MCHQTCKPAPATTSMSLWRGHLRPDRSDRQAGVQGSIPQAWSGLRELRMLEMGRNQLTGQPPMFLGRLPQLRSVWLQNNNLGGPVPQAWCDQEANDGFAVELSVRLPLAQSGHP